MKGLIDASSIFDSISAQKIDILTEYSTIDIARYEIGNILWKHTYLLRTYAREQSMQMLKLLTNAFNRMHFYGIVGSEEEILEHSISWSISFYDAAYLYFAQREQAPVITEDNQMMKKARELGLDSFSIKMV